ncbi:hypothetical protein MIMGU_mgv1a022467mg [Erythranthe guttata]|uniref:Small ribosomal subunit protein uS7 domain-containing protein n=1 Tax=Erythranthe guttata TaxID=4155 RepID=A0A022QMU4_ERYGU|nr:hypothetical protein MIMGU_mgv1a022467mg [Erythranthe guttata]
MKKNKYRWLKYQIIYRAMKKNQQKIETNPLFVLRQTIHGESPDIAVKARRVGKTLDIHWLLAAFRKRSGRNMAFKLRSDLVVTTKGSGDAIHKNVETRKMAAANREILFYMLIL